MATQHIAQRLNRIESELEKIDPSGIGNPMTGLARRMEAARMRWEKLTPRQRLEEDAAFVPRDTSGLISWRHIAFRESMNRAGERRRVEAIAELARLDREERGHGNS